MKSSDLKDIDRPQFFLGMITLCALFAIEAGLLGIGLLRHVVQSCAYIALFVWFAVVPARGGHRRMTAQQQALLLPPDSFML